MVDLKYYWNKVFTTANHYTDDPYQYVYDILPIFFFHQSKSAFYREVKAKGENHQGWQTCNFFGPQLMQMTTLYLLVTSSVNKLVSTLVPIVDNKESQDQLGFCCNDYYQYQLNGHQKIIKISFYHLQHYYLLLLDMIRYMILAP
ncbi:unnamed protein product [Absidia cylindrospora]